MGNENITQVSVEPAHPKEHGAGHTIPRDGIEEGAISKEEVAPAGLSNFFVCCCKRKNALMNFAKNFQRVLKFGDSFDWVMIGICFFSALASGIAMPLMFLVFGKMVGDFTAYFNTTAPIVIGSFVFKPDVITKDQFKSKVNQNA